MKKGELETRLQEEGYDPSTYSFNVNAPPTEGYILEKVGERWTIFYTDRGYLHDVASFKYESDACDYFYRELRRVYFRENK